MSASSIVSQARLVLAAPGEALQTMVATVNASGSSADNPSSITGLTNIGLIAGPGQSNAGYAETQDGAFLALAQAVGFYLQSSGTPNIFSAWVNAGQAGTEVSGAGVMEIVTASLYGNSFLANSGGGDFSVATATNAGLGLCGNGYEAYLQSLSSAQLADVQALVFYWGETDSLEYGPVDKAVYKAAVVNLISQVRSMIARSASQLPVLFFGPPYGLFPNYINYPPSLREAWMELDADTTLNFSWVVRQTYDTISRAESWNPSTGVSSGGNTDGGHRSATDNVALFKRAAIATARAVLAANGFSASLIPASLGTGLGPQITSASLLGTSLTLTITHDGGTDLVVPLLASQGVGFSLMDGGDTASPGPIIQAISCARLDATHLSVELASAPESPHQSCRLLYPWAGEYWAVQPDTEIGRGCAVTDNFSTVPLPSGFDINAQFGIGWAANMPLQTPVTLSSGIASYGISLSS